MEDGKLIYRLTGMPVDTTEASKWIFVLSTTRALYVGQKKKGVFQHSSFLAGGATTAAGRLVARDGVLEVHITYTIRYTIIYLWLGCCLLMIGLVLIPFQAIWPYSGHYHPTEENFREFISFLEENHMDLSNVKVYINICLHDYNYLNLSCTFFFFFGPMYIYILSRLSLLCYRDVQLTTTILHSETLKRNHHLNQ